MISKGAFDAYNDQKKKLFILELGEAFEGSNKGNLYQVN